MTKKFSVLLLAVCLMAGSVGCAVTTTGGADWEVYSGFRTLQRSTEPASVELKADKIVDLLLKPDKTEEE